MRDTSARLVERVLPAASYRPNTGARECALARRRSIVQREGLLIPAAGDSVRPQAEGLWGEDRSPPPKTRSYFADVKLKMSVFPNFPGHTFCGCGFGSGGPSRESRRQRSTAEQCSPPRTSFQTPTP
jgi:hypothetical protein